MDVQWDDAVDPNLDKEVHLGALEKQYGLDSGVLKGVWNTESAKGHAMRTKLSSAKGHFQFIDSTAKQYGLKNPDDFYESADAAARYLKDLKNEFGDMTLALAAYKAGPGAVRQHGINAPAIGKNADPNYINKVYGSPDEANIQWEDETPAEPAAPAPAPAEPDGEEALKNQMADAQQRYEQQNLGGLPAVAEEVRSMPWLDKAAISAGRVASGFQYGAKDFGNFLADVAGDTKAVQRSADLSKAREEETRLYKPFEESAGISAPLVGGMLPYLVPTPINPVVRKAGQAVVDATALPFAAARTGTQTGIAALAEKAAASPHLVPRAIGKQLQRDLVAPAQLNKTARLNQVKLKDPYYEDIAPTMVGNTIQGAVEGALNYDTDAKSGALASAVGTSGGLSLRKLTNRLPDYRRKPERELLDWYKQQGGQPSIGLDSGSRRMQNFENKLEKSDRWSDATLLYKQENQLIDNKIAYETMGIKNAKPENLTPAQLSEHIKALGTEMDELAEGSVAKFTKADEDTLSDLAMQVANSPTKSFRTQAKKVTDYTTAIQNNIAQVRDPITGRIVTNKALVGKNFQTIRSQLQADISTAYNQGNVTLAKALEPIKKTLDDALERGVAEAKGETTLAKWKEANTKYAMSHIVLEHGMNPGGVDAKKLHSYFSQSEPKKYFLEHGNTPKNQLQKLAKIGYLRSTQDTAFGGIKNPGSQTAIQSLIGTPLAGMLPGFERLALSAYKSGIPAKYGLLGMGKNNKFKLGDIEWSMPNFWRGPEVYTRALGQSTQVVPQIFNYLNSLKEDFDSRRKEK